MTRFPNGEISVRAGFSCLLSRSLCVSVSLSVCHSELLFLTASETIAVVVDESCTYGVG